MKTQGGRIKLKGIVSDAFIVPTDKAALDNLKALPVLPDLIRKFNELALDRMLYVHNTASSVRCGAGQFPSLYKLLREACKILDVPEPELYVRYHVQGNAFTAGVERPFIVLNSPIVDILTDDELLCVIGHELGHIKCEHVLYQSVGAVLAPLIQAIGSITLGIGTLAGQGVVAAFYEWMRQAEFTCDRAGLLACQDVATSLSAAMKLGAGHTRLSAEMNVEAFLQQARDYVDHAPTEGLAKALLFLTYKWRLSHPEIVHRAKAIDEWARTGSYQAILSGNYESKPPG
jgi:Zn-dependent protease with chaperone function